MKSTFLFSAFTCVISSITFAQDAGTDSHTIGVAIPEIAILDIEPAASKNLSFTFTHNGESGTALVNPAPDSTLWLNYSVIIPSANPFLKKITAQLDALIPGVDISVAVAPWAGSGAGAVGNAQGISTPIELKTTAEDLVFNIGSCYTGDMTASGHNLIYSIAFAENNSALYEDLRSDNTNLSTVTYTILDE